MKAIYIFQKLIRSYCRYDGWLMLNNFDKLPKKKYMDDLPSETWHGYKYIDFGPDGNLYIPVGVPCNIV